MKTWCSDFFPRDFLRKRIIPLFILGLTIAIFEGMGRKPPKDELPHFLEIAPGLYRGGQPTEKGFEELKSLGIRTIVNFRNEEKEIEWDRVQAKQWGMEYVNIPWTIQGRPDLTVLERFSQIVENPAARPVFIHCQRGVERTGVLSSIYFLKYEKLSEKEAFEKGVGAFPVLWYWKPFVKGKFEFFKRAVQKIKSSEANPAKPPEPPQSS